ncbi:primosomal protein N' [Ichthyenterobacterium sp. W332]|uniref:Replication restart protein PriA n=1 Tax=Microcosmobacter mediterraneus TaxID=3075607 RepID=A0ABU2YPY4_9FLAO|nr:primosomal protein N' [Ichthyenterobacterium sp. W332]MDT0559108.1 primosomal protein N' [Ichthyenterobacterium sp. W332]
MNFFIDVILPIPLQKLYTYSITKAESDFVSVGTRVAVPFGKSKIYTAIVSKIHHEEPKVYVPKSIHQILDESPVITNQQINLWNWISKYYMCSLGEVMRAALPSAFLLESETLISKIELEFNDLDLSDNEFLIYEALQFRPKLKVAEIAAITDRKTVLPLIKQLLEKGIIEVHEEIYEKYKPKLVRYVHLNAIYSNDEKLQELIEQLKRAKKQQQMVLSYFSINSGKIKATKVSDLIKVSGGSSTTVKALIDKGVFLEDYIQEDRVVFNDDNRLEQKSLNQFQNKALEDIKSAFKNHDVALLHGVTSSGKTEVYAKLIASALSKQKNVLYLVPEIALTTQLVGRLQSYFGEKVIVYHSRYSLNERVEAWYKLLNNTSEGFIVLGARSSVLLPLPNLDLIIVDEEHEQSYKQFDPAPRYHARDTAIVLAKFSNAKILLGSATPSLESYYNASNKKYGIVELNERFNNLLLPEMELVDIKDKLKRKRMTGHFSDRLIEEIQFSLEEKGQIILFQNRRGFAPIVECKTCGHSPQCPNCDVSLTYHQFRSELRCHYCSHNIPMIKNCDACGNTSLDTKGFGTEQIETEVKLLFPNYKVARMDLDTTRGKHGYKKVINAFESGSVDILVGTQMLTKGLDFKNVRLVGIMNADTLLNFPDFRAHERSFQLMAQVAGRSGRQGSRGKVLIQTYNPYHKILQQVASHDYKSMYDEQIDQRHNFKYPPVYRLIRITLRQKDYNKVNLASDWMAKSLRQILGSNVLGPEYPSIARIRNQYNKHILVKIPGNQSITKTKEAILKVKNSFTSISEFKSVRVVLNVDNY